MLPLIPLLIDLAPSIANWLFGPTAGQVASKAAAAVQAVTGIPDATTADGVAAAQAVIAGKPELAAQLRAQLAQIAAEHDQAANAALAAGLADIQSARSQTVALAGAHSTMAYGAAALSAIILLAFTAVLIVVLTVPLPPGSVPIITVVLGALVALTTQVGNYWLGSSAGSLAKSADLRAATDALAASTPVTTDDLNNRSLAAARAGS